MRLIPSPRPLAPRMAEARKSNQPIYVSPRHPYNPNGVLHRAWAHPTYVTCGSQPDIYTTYCGREITDEWEVAPPPSTWGWPPVFNLCKTCERAK